MTIRLLALALLAAAPAAQIVPDQPASFTGVVQQVSFDASLICAPPTHALECSGGTFFLKNGAADLDTVVGKMVKVSGYPSAAGCPVWAIDLIEPPPVTLKVCGTTALSCEVRFRSWPGGLSQHALLVSLAPGVAPLNLVAGSLLLGDPWFVLLTQVGHFPPEGADFVFNVPIDTALAGLDFWFQTARRQVGPVGPLQLSNAICFQMGGIPFVCWPADCGATSDT